MKTALKIVGLCSVGFLVVGAIVLVVLQHQSLERENQLLKQQVDQLTADNNQWATEKKRLLEIIAAQPNPASLPQEQFIELLRLRGEVGRLRLQEREIERVRRGQMHAAQTKLPYAKAEFERLTKLHADNAVSAQQLGQARFAVELLEAEAQGDASKAAQVRLRQAEEELERASELYRQQAVSETEYNQARYAVDVARAELRGDEVEAGQIKLRQAEEELTRAAELRSQSRISEEEYNEAVLRVELLRVGTKP
jgi:hypothetical protein